MILEKTDIYVSQHEQNFFHCSHLPNFLVFRPKKLEKKSNILLRQKPLNFMKAHLQINKSLEL